MIRLRRLSGMRPGEVSLMRTCDVDRSDSEVWVYRPFRHKTEHHGHVRKVPLCPSAQNVLQDWLRDDDPERFLFSPADAEKERRAERRKARKTKVQPSQRNRRKPRPKRKPRDRYDTSSYNNAVRRGCDKADVGGWRSNQLRHTFATETEKQNGSVATSVMLGHANVRTTQIYIERDDELGKRVAADLG